jgi:hypothetical protein
MIEKENDLPFNCDVHYLEKKEPNPTTRIEVLEGPDDKGRWTFFVYWMADYHPGHPEGEHVCRERGQIFKTANIAKYQSVKTIEDKRSDALTSKHQFTTYVV